MALVISDRIKETTNTVGTQTFQLEGAVTGFETFASNLSDGDTTYYAVTDNTNFEVGLGTINEGASQTINYTVTVVSDGGNKFALNGVTNPVITFVKGFTYVFDVSDSTNGSHPLRFRTSADASYTDGVSVSGTQGQANATVTIVVASDAPSTLKYYCTAHGNAMGNTINVISAVATLARTTILASSNSNNAVSFGSGTKTIFCTLPAGKAVIKDASDNINGTFVGNITGNVTGNASGTAATVTGAAQTNITSLGTLTGLTVGTTNGDQTLNVASHDLVDGGLQLAGTLVTSSAAELNILDGVTATATEINKLDGVTATTTELNYVDVSTAGTVEASKAVVVDSNKDVSGFRNLGATGTVTLTGGDDGDIMIIFNTDRTWQFQQNGDGGTTSLGLKANTDSKSFVIQNSNGDIDFNFFTSHTGTPNFTLGKDAVLRFEGSSDDANETTLTVTDPTADRTITLPNATGTVLTTGNSDTPTTTTSSSDADFVLVDDGGTMKKITPTNLGITAGAASLDDATALAIALG